MAFRSTDCCRSLRFANTHRRRAPRGIAFCLEALEGRIVPALGTWPSLANSFTNVVDEISTGPNSPLILDDTDTNVTIQVDPLDSNMVQVLVTTTDTVVATYPNSSLTVIAIVGDANSNTVTINEGNGVVDAPLSFDGGGSPAAPGDQMIVLGTNSNDSLNLSPTAAATADLTFDGSPAYSFSNINQFTFDGEDGNDTMTIDSTASLLDLSAGIFYDGGTGVNQLALLQTGGSTQTSDTYTVIANPGQGSDVIIGTAGTQSVFFQNLAPVYDNVPSPLYVVGTPASNTINYESGPNSLNLDAPYDGDSTGLVTVDNLESLEFSRKSTLTLQGSNGDDTFIINSTSTPTDLTAINVDGQAGNNTLTVDANSALVLGTMVTSTQVDIPGATPVPIGYNASIDQVNVIHARDTLFSIGSLITGVAGEPIVNASVSLFLISDYTQPVTYSDPGAFTATIQWGDYTSSFGTVVQMSSNGATAPFSVEGTHTYSQPSAPDMPYQISVTVNDTGSVRTFTPTGGVPTQIFDLPGATTTTPAPPDINPARAIVLDAPVTAQAAPIAAVAGQPLAGTAILATFLYGNPSQTSAAFNATVNWGDDTPTVSATITAPAGAGVPFNVSQAAVLGHTYARQGNYVTTIVISDQWGTTTIVNGAVTVADAPLAFAAQQPIHTIEATILPVSASVPPLFVGPVASFTDANPAATATDFTASVNWGDGTPPTTGTVVPGPEGTFLVDGSHTYADAGVNGGTGTFAIQAFITDAGGSTLTVPNTALVDDMPLLLTGTLNPASDSGMTNGDYITNESQPNFYGMSAPFATISLFATPLTGGSTVKIGQAAARSDGSWSVNSNLLADGALQITATAVDQSGNTTTLAPVTIVPTLIVDSAPPVMSSLSFNRRNGTLTVIFKDNLSGMNLTSLSNSAFYHISAAPLSRSVRPPRLILPTRILYAYTGIPSDPVVVRVVFNNGHPMRGGNYEVVVDSGTGDRGIQDIVGNALDGNYYGRFPTGDGLPGGDFVATIATFHNRVLAGIPVKDGYVPPVAGVDSRMGGSSVKIRRLEQATHTGAEREHGFRGHHT